MIDEDSLKMLTSRGLSLLRLDLDDWENIGETRFGGRRFSLTFPHEIARRGRRKSLVLIVVDSTHVDLQLGWIRSIQSISTFDSRVVFEHVRPLKHTSTLYSLVDPLSSTTLRSAATALPEDDAEFRHVSSKLGERLIRDIAAEPANAGTLHLILGPLRKQTHFQDARASQQDAIELALKAFGAIDGATSVYLPAETALSRVRLQEDTVIEHDARFIEGWSLSTSDVTGRAIFTKPGEQLEVITANKRPLETLLGVDLIYHNQIQGSIVMVQYKMMEPQPRGRHLETSGQHSYDELDEKEWVVSVDRQFKDEIAGMATFDRDLAPDGPYRLHSGAFFLKLIKRYASTSASSILMSLGHFNHMLDRGDLSGPREGLRLSYSRLGNQYLRTDAFVELVRSGYIGTRGATTDHFNTLISQTLNAGRSLIVAVQKAIESSVDHAESAEESLFDEEVKPRRTRHQTPSV